MHSSWGHMNDLYSESQKLLAMRGVASTIIGPGSKFMLLPSAHAHGTSGQYCAGRILFVNEIRLYVL